MTVSVFVHPDGIGRIVRTDDGGLAVEGVIRDCATSTRMRFVAHDRIELVIDGALTENPALLEEVKGRAHANAIATLAAYEAKQNVRVGP